MGIGGNTRVTGPKDHQLAEALNETNSFTDFEALLSEHIQKKISSIGEDKADLIAYHLFPALSSLKSNARREGIKIGHQMAQDEMRRRLGL